MTLASALRLEFEALLQELDSSDLPPTWRPKLMSTVYALARELEQAELRVEQMQTVIDRADELVDKYEAEFERLNTQVAALRAQVDKPADARLH